MKTIRDILDSSHIDEAATRAADKTPNKSLLIYSDDRMTGLQIRCQGKQAFWNLRYARWTKVLGYVYPDTKRHVTSVTEARDLAQAAKEVLDDDEDMLDPFLVKYYAIRDSYKKKADAVKAARVEMRSKPTTWTLRQCLEFMIEHRQSDECDPADRVGTHAIAEWSLTLRRKPLQKLFDRPVVLLNQGHFDDPRKEILLENGRDPANKAMSNIRSCLEYCMRVQSLNSGLSHKDKWWQLIQSAGEPERQTRTPFVDEVVRTLILAEEYLHKPLPGRTDGKHGVRHNVFAALWWLVLTAQRTYAGLHIRHIGYFPDSERPGSGWYLANWSEDVMKAKKSHVLPIPPRVVKFMAPLVEAVKSHGNSEWLFPSERGDEDDDKTVGRSGVRQCLQRLAANDPLSKDEKGERKEGFIDLFAQLHIPWWTPHDLRRTIGVELDKAAMPGGHSVILAHKIDAPKDSKTDKRRADWLQLYVQDVTRKAYHDPLMMDLKSRAMLAWTNAILDRYEALHPTHRQIRKKERVERILRTIYADARSAERARNLALESLPEIRHKLESTLTDHHQMLSFLMKKSPLPIKDVRTAHSEIERAKSNLDTFLADPESYAIEPSRATGVRGLYSLMASPNEPNVDLEKEAPAYTELRDRYISGKTDYEAFKRLITERYPITLDMMDDRIIVGTVTGDEVL